MFKKESIPFAPSLIESMRSIGYSFEAAIADLIDNSISANATRIDIRSEVSINPYIIILDNGNGMNEIEIEEAMRYGSKNPLDQRDENDLGRFGLGLKSASLSQCRKLTVVSKKDNKLNAYSWDINYIIENGSWTLIGYSEDEIDELPEIELLKSQDSGTYVLLQDFDRIQVGTNNLEKTLLNKMDDAIEHLSLVFHRFLENKLRMYINNQKIEAKDPFLTTNKGTQVKRSQNITIQGVNIEIKPYILPHISKLTKSDIEKIGSKEKLRTEQGFYIYRNKRLIIWGTWFRLERKDELSKLARVKVDIPSELDYMWNIDIKKSSANLPDIIKRNLFNCVIESVGGSQSVHNYRGRKQNNNDVDYIWDRYEERENCYRYRINRNIPQIKLLESTLDKNQKKSLEALLVNLEESFPVQTLYLDAAKGHVINKDEAEEEKRLYDEVVQQINYAKEIGIDYRAIVNAFIKTEPYCNYKSVVERVRGEFLNE